MGGGGKTRKTGGWLLIYAIISAIGLSQAFIHAWDLSTVAGYLIDFATVYQASYAIIHGHLLGDTVVPGIPLMVEHFMPVAYLTAWIALLPARLAYIAWWTLYYALLTVFLARLSRRSSYPWLAIAMYPAIIFTAPTEPFLYTVFAPLGTALIWMSDYAWGSAALALGFAGSEYVGPYIAFAMDLVRWLREWRAGRKYVPWVAIASVAVALVQAAYLTLVREAVGVHAGALATVLPTNATALPGGLPAVDSVKVLMYVMNTGVLPVFTVESAPLAVLLLLPLLYASPIYVAPFTYYQAPFFVALATWVGRERRVRLISVDMPPWLVLAIALVATYVIAMWLINGGIGLIPPATPYIAVAKLEEVVNPRITPLHTFYLTNGILCGYPPTWAVLTCAPFSPAIVINHSPALSKPNITGWAVPLITLSNYATANPPMPPNADPSVVLIAIGNATAPLGGLSIGGLRLVLTPRQVAGMLAREYAYDALLFAVAWLAVAPVITAIAYRWLEGEPEDHDGVPNQLTKT